MGAAMPAPRARPARKTEKLKSWGPEARREGQVPRFPPRRPLIRRTVPPGFAYTARDMGAAE